ncbi:MAG: acyl-CoA synthetase [Gemmatimonas sp.]
MDLPPILVSHVSAADALHELSLPADHPVFRGHFPGRPVLPGVAQIDWAVRLAARAWGLPEVARDFQVKFRNVIPPGVPVALALRYDRTKRQLHFEYRSDDRVMSSGRIAVEEPRA